MLRSLSFFFFSQWYSPSIFKDYNFTSYHHIPALHLTFPIGDWSKAYVLSESNGLFIISSWKRSFVLTCLGCCNSPVTDCCSGQDWESLLSLQCRGQKLLQHLLSHPAQSLGTMFLFGVFSLFPPNLCKETFLCLTGLAKHLSQFWQSCIEGDECIMKWVWLGGSFLSFKEVCLPSPQ